MSRTPFRQVATMILSLAARQIGSNAQNCVAM
jgi:hypothetical protein